MKRTLQAVLFLCLLCVHKPLLCQESAEKSPGLDNWHKGQQALLDGQSEQALALFRRSLEQDPNLSRNHLSLAAAYLALGKESEAAEHLARYLKVQPDHCLVRGQYAELLLRLDRLDEAREQFESFDAVVQENEAPNRQQVAHCHTRLLDIAARLDDAYAMHLHRGIGLYWLALQRAELTEENDDISTEGLLCQAASELLQARRQRRDEARPCWYLHEVWTALGQHQPATRWLRLAESAAPLSYLTPAEQRQLHFACRRLAEEGSRK